jgi:hypothetical protein
MAKRDFIFIDEAGEPRHETDYRDKNEKGRCPVRAQPFSLDIIILTQVEIKVK